MDRNAARPNMCVIFTDFDSEQGLRTIQLLTLFII